ncbi:hypothetical protein [Acidiphilium sp.]
MSPIAALTLNIRRIAIRALGFAPFVAAVLLTLDLGHAVVPMI